MSSALSDVAAEASDAELVAVASDTFLRFTNEEIKDGRAGDFELPSGDGFGTDAFVADRSASCELGK